MCAEAGMQDSVLSHWFVTWGLCNQVGLMMLNQGLRFEVKGNYMSKYGHVVGNGSVWTLHNVINVLTFITSLLYSCFFIRECSHSYSLRFCAILLVLSSGIGLLLNFRPHQ